MTLTLVQRKLLKLLTINCRYTNRDLAQALGVSADTVEYQIEKLLAEHYLSFEFRIDCRTFGYEYYQFFISLKDPDVDMARVVALPFVTFFGKTIGAYEYEGTFLVKDEKEKLRAIASIKKILGTSLRKLHVGFLSTEFKFSYIMEPFSVPVAFPKNQKNLLYAQASENVVSAKSHLGGLDKIDYRILGEFANNPRVPYLHIAQKLEISHETVRNRIKQLVERGLQMSFTAFPNFDAFGYFSHCLLLRIEKYDRAAFERFAQERIYIQFAGALEGDYDLLIYTTEKNPAEFAKHASEIRSFFGLSLIEMQLFYFEKYLKNLQFPMSLFIGEESALNNANT